MALEDGWGACIEQLGKLAEQLAQALRLKDVLETLPARIDLAS